MRYAVASGLALLLSASLAQADISLTGEARMGVIHAEDNIFGLKVRSTKFTARARVKFNMSAETDSGLTFGASFRADQAGRGPVDRNDDGDLDWGAVGGNATGNTRMESGSVFIKSSIGTISFGDNPTAAKAIVGNVSGVGLTGLGNWQRLDYAFHTDTSVAYSHKLGGMEFGVSASQVGTDDLISVAAKYSNDRFSAALGYEIGTDSGYRQTALGLSANIGNATLKLVTTEKRGAPRRDLAMSVDYTTGATTLTAYGVKHIMGTRAGGIGASYDLGGGASFVGGVAKSAGVTQADMGLSFSF